MTRIVVLIQGTDRKPWSGLRVAQLETWIGESKRAQIWHYEGRSSGHAELFDSLHEYLRWSPIFYRAVALTDRAFQHRIRAGGPPEVEADRRNRVIRVLLPDVYLLGGKKFMGALKWAIDEYDPEWIYRTTVSSYVDLEGLNEFVDECRPIGYYGGSPVGHPRGEFASGTNFLLSRDVADRILAAHRKWSHLYLEDLALGVLMRDMKIELQPIVTKSITSLNQVDSLSDEDLLGTWHYRCKVENSDGSRLDSAIMHALQFRFHEMRR